VQVAERFVELALTTPYEQCLAHWTKQRSNLSKSDAGWEFADPMCYPLAPSPVQPYADRRAFAKRLRREHGGALGGGGNSGEATAPTAPLGATEVSETGHADTLLASANATTAITVGDEEDMW